MVAASAAPPIAAPRRRGRVRFAATLVVLLLALAAAGAAVALVVASPDTTPVDSTPDRRVEPATQTVDPTTPAGDPGSTDPAELTDDEVRAGAEEVLDRHHRLLQKAAGNADDPNARKAYALLSSDKRAAEEADAETSGYASGFAFWISKRGGENLRIGQSVTVPSELVTVEEWDPETGVAFVCADFGAYGGRTWVLYEDGKWTYDAGYGHKPEREARYKSGYALFGPGNAATC
jgi:hypothetical protein